MVGNKKLYFQVQLLLEHLLRPAYLKDLFKALSFFSYILMILQIIYILADDTILVLKLL